MRLPAGTSGVTAGSRGGVSRQRYKTLVLGAPGAGKTSLVRRLAEGASFEIAGGPPRQRGLDFYTCAVPLRDDISVTLQLWDVSNCPTGRPDDDPGPLAAYLYNCQAVLLVYDVTDSSSLAALRYALAAVETATAGGDGGAGNSSGGGGGGARPYLALVANKCDRPGPWAASEALARELAARHGCTRFTLAAASGEGVAEAAVQLACDLAGVPLAATDHRSRFAAAAAAALDGGPLPALAEPWAAAPASAGTGAADAARAPVYRTAAVGVGEADMRSLVPGGAAAGGGGAGVGSGSGSGVFSQPWRPVSSTRGGSRSGTPSPTAMLISKTGPLGQRMPVRSTSPLNAGGAVGVGDGGGGDGLGGAAGAGTAGVAAGARVGTGGLGQKRSGWRALCCCG